MKSLWQKLHKIGDILHLPDLPNWLLGLLMLVLILRIPSFFEPYYYGDEMIYMTLGHGVRQGVTLYKDLHDNKPPLLYLTAALAGNLFWFKVILAFWSIITIIFFYKLMVSLFQENEHMQKLATAIFATLSTIPLLEGNTVNAEPFMIGLSIISIIILTRKNLGSKNIFIAGILFGIATLFKVPAMFDLPVIVFYWIITDFKNFRRIVPQTLILVLGFVIPILITFVWYYVQGIGPEYIKAAFLQNVGYLSSFRPGDVQKSFIERNLPLIIRGIIVLFGLIVLFVNKKRLSNRFVLLSIWILLALFAASLSERPYPHYFVQTLAPFSALVTMLFLEKTIEQVLVIIPITLSLIVPVMYKFYFYPTSSYYLRFVSFATGSISKEKYFSTFSQYANRDRAISEFLANSSSVKDRVFMWDSNSAAVYAMSKRLPPIKYTVPYHVDDFSSRKDIAKLIVNNPPKFIVLTTERNFPEIQTLLAKKYLLIQQIENANIYTRLDLAR